MARARVYYSHVFIIHIATNQRPADGTFLTVINGTFLNNIIDMHMRREAQN